MLLFVITAWSQNLNLNQGIIGGSAVLMGDTGVSLPNASSYVEFLESPHLKLSSDLTIRLNLKNRALEKDVVASPGSIYGREVLTIVDSTFSGFTYNGIPVPSISAAFALSLNVIDTLIDTVDFLGDSAQTPHLLGYELFASVDSSFVTSGSTQSVVIAGINSSKRLSLNDTLWHQIIFQRTGLTYSLYLDGTCVGTTTGSAVSVVGTHVFVGACGSLLPGNGAALMNVSDVQINNYATAISRSVTQMRLVPQMYNSRIVTDLLGRSIISSKSAPQIVVEQKMRIIRIRGSE